MLGDLRDNLRRDPLSVGKSNGPDRDAGMSAHLVRKSIRSLRYRTYDNGTAIEDFHHRLAKEFGGYLHWPNLINHNDLLAF